jgi:hypothetical protein
MTEGGYLIGRRTGPGRPALTGKARGGRPHRLHRPTWRCRYQHRVRQARQRWNSYAETTP